MTALSDKLNGLAGGSSPVAAAPQPVASTGGSLTDKLNAANGGPAPAAPSITNPPADSTGNSVFYDMFHPQPADLSHPQSWRDWATKTYSPTATDYGNAALDDVSMGSADYMQAGYGGEDVDKIRQRTAASQAALGPMGPIVNAATYVAGPGKILGPLAAIGKGAKAGVGAVRAAIEGGAAGAISSEGHDLGGDKSPTERAWDATKQGAKSAALGVTGNLAGHGAVKVFQPAFDAAQGAPGRVNDPIFSELRKASTRGENISPDVQWFQDTYGHDMSPVLDAQKTGTGPATNLTRMASNLAGKWAATHIPGVGQMSLFSNTPGELGEAAHDAVVNRIRNYTTQKAFDQVYPNVAGSPLHADTSGWKSAIRQGFIGGSLP